MNKKRLIITSVISIILVIILMLGSTYSIFTTSDTDEELNVYTTGNLDIIYTLSSENITFTNHIPTTIKDSIWITPYRIAITNSGTVPYMFDVILEDVTATEVIDNKYIMVQVGKLEPKKLSECEVVNSKYVIKEDVILLANSSVDVDVRVWIADDIKNTEITKSFNAKLVVDGVAIYEKNTDIDNSKLIADLYVRANSPNLDDGNLIPVYYDEDDGVWRKANSTNKYNSWYNYENKEWANAVLIKDSVKRAKYQSVDVGTEITESDISVFLVWIPRFKYRVWNITRQGGDESTYAYPAYSEGIDIEWEKEDVSTGNVVCSYNVLNSSPSTTLSDNCIYDGETLITPTSGNTNYKDAWYTHPAFYFGGVPKTGFWIGKFETTGAADDPTVLPDTKALVNQKISAQFTTAKLFQTYGLSNNLNVHMLTNLEWGAMAYLTHSIYGLCDNGTCRDAYMNNSSGKYTGRSAGVLASSASSSTYGAYNYEGYYLNSSTGELTTTKDITKVASTTGNITWLYDIVGGGVKNIMGNQVNTSNAFYPASSGNSWAGSTTLSSIYYNAYSYGTTYTNQVAYNRSILGDATGEVAGLVDTGSDIWYPGTGITGSVSGFVENDTPWFFRGGYYGYAESSSFFFNSYSGGGGAAYSFRLSIS